MKKDRIAKGFDRLAPVYTCLTRIVFDKTLNHAQAHFLDKIKSGDRVLILGGGSGDLLNTLLKQQPNLLVDYIDISKNMIALAREKTQNTVTVNFIVGTEQIIPQDKYSIVITNFYLDLFSENTLPHTIKKIKSHLSPQAQWLITDFVITKKRWHKILLWLMYRFFRLSAGIEADHLPHWEKHLVEAGLTETCSKTFMNGFIKSAVFTSGL